MSTKTEYESELMRAVPFGLGKPSTGQYSIKQGGWKSFGGQGQAEKDPLGWVVKHSELCQERYIQVLVMHRYESFKTTNSHVTLDILISDVENGARILYPIFIFLYLYYF
jgi:hypothetical protein